jgi:uncharacterized membrane protein YphA (DoxX/SURF4 family)
MVPAAAKEMPLTKGLNITLWVLQMLAALAFLAAGGLKLAGAAPMVAEFEKIGLGQWFRYLTGLLEVTGAIGLLIPQYTFYGAAILVMVMGGAIITHFTVLGGSPVAAIVLLLITGTIAYFWRSK